MISLTFKILLVFFFIVHLNAQERALEKVSLQLQWLDQFQFAGYYVAKEKGYYEEAGLDVKLKKFNSSIDTFDEVQKQKATFGIGRSSLIVKSSKGAKIKLLASIFQSSPSVILATKSSNITSIKDFNGKKAMLTQDISLGASLNAMAMKSGFKLSDMTFLEHSFKIEDLINNTTDLMSAYISNEPFLLQERGIEYTVFDPKEYGFDFYSDLLFTSAAQANTNKEQTSRFIEASLKGWEYAFEHIDETVSMIYEKYNEQHKSKAALKYEAQELKKLAYYQTKKLGNISFDKIQRIHDIYNVMGTIKHPMNIDDLLFKKNTSKRIHLTQQETKYLENIEVIKMCTIPDALPYSKIDKGEFIGISHDYIELISKSIQKKFELVPTKNWEESHQFIHAKKCDILPIVQKSHAREKYLNFTNAYISVPLVIATTSDEIFISDITAILDHKFAIAKSHALRETLTKLYPTILLVDALNTQDGLQKVASKEVFGYIGGLANVAYEIQNLYANKIQISGYAGPNIDISIGVTKQHPLLLSILNKAIDAISIQEKQVIKNKWLSVHIHPPSDYTLVWKIVLLFIVIFITIMIFIRKQNIHKKELEQSQEKLKNYLYLMLDGFAILDASTKKFVFCNQEFENMTGYKIEDLKELTMDKIHPEKSLKYIHEQTKKQILGEITIAHNIPVLHKNGDIAVFDVDTREVVINNQVLYFGSFRSLSQNVQKQHALRDENIKLKKLLSKYE